MSLPQLPGPSAENCTPPLGISDEAREYINSLQEHDRVIECGVSGITGRLGTVYISKKDGPANGTVCVRWDTAPGELGQMGSSITWGARKVQDAGTFREYAEAYEAQEGPYASDGCDSDGFPGGCVRAGHTPENCPGPQIGDTIRFNDNHIAAGDLGIIVAKEMWLNPRKTVAWDGCGDPPVYDSKDTCLDGMPNRFLIRLFSYAPTTTYPGTASWRDRCLAYPHDYPFVTARDFDLVSRPQIRVCNDSGCHGSVFAVDKHKGLSGGPFACVTDSEAMARKLIADMKASAGIPLRYPPVRGDGKIRFCCEESTETKVAPLGGMNIGFQFWCSTVFGVAKATVISIEGTKAEAAVGGGSHVTFLECKADGWYDQHVVVSLAAIDKVKVTFEAGINPIITPGKESTDG